MENLKVKRQKERYRYNMYVLQALTEHHGLSTDFIRKSLRGDRTSEMSLKIKEEYNILQKEFDSVVKKYKERGRL